MSLKNKATTALLAALTGAMIPLAAQAQTALLNDIDYTDVWWNPQRSGWGMNLVQQQNAAYVSLHDYKTDGTPTWYVAPLTRRADGSFAGDVYRHASAPVSAPLTAGQVSGTPIGTFVFTPVSQTQGKIAYTIDGQQGEQTITRFTFASEPFEAKNKWGYMVESSWLGCPPSDYKPRTMYGLFLYGPSSFFTQESDGKKAARVDLGGGCNIAGTLVTEGRLGRLDGAKLTCQPDMFGMYIHGPRGPIPAQVTFESSPGRLETRWSTGWVPISTFIAGSPGWDHSQLEGNCIAEGRQVSTDYPLDQANSTDYTDVWWNPQQSGWGMNLARQNDRIYATLHAYNTNGAPLWYVAYLDEQNDKSFSGALYSFASTPTNEPLSPGQTSGTTRGTLKFIPHSASEGVIRYNIDGQQGEQSVKRFSLLSQPFPTSNPIAGTNDWDASSFAVKSNCVSEFSGDTYPGPAVKVTIGPLPSTIRIDLKVFALTFDFEPFGESVGKPYNCTITGHLTSDGQLSRIDDAKYSCMDAETRQAVWTQLPVKVTDIRVSASQLDGYWDGDIPNLNLKTGTQTGSCNQKGHFVLSNFSTSPFP